VVRTAHRTHAHSRPVLTQLVESSDTERAFF